MQSAVVERVESEERPLGLSVGALGRSMALLEALAAAEGPRNLTFLVATVGLPKTTTHRLLQTLLANELVVRNRSGYALSHRMRDLAERVSAREAELRRALMPFLVNLYERVGQVVRLGVLRGDDCVYLETLRGHRHAGTLGSSADRLPAHTTAAGKLLLAYRDQGGPVIPRQRPLPRLTNYTVVDPQQLAVELNLIRRAGLAVSIQEQRVGLTTVAMPVVGESRVPVAAIEIAGDANVFDPRGVSTPHRQTVFAASLALRGMA